jgi:hypothetical protein
MRTNEWTLFLFLRGETIAEESRGGGAWDNNTTGKTPVPTLFRCAAMLGSGSPCAYEHELLIMSFPAWIIAVFDGGGVRNHTAD